MSREVCYNLLLWGHLRRVTQYWNNFIFCGAYVDTTECECSDSQTRGTPPRESMSLVLNLLSVLLENSWFLLKLQKQNGRLSGIIKFSCGSIYPNFCRYKTSKTVVALVPVGSCSTHGISYFGTSYFAEMCRNNFSTSYFGTSINQFNQSIQLLPKFRKYSK